MPELAWTRGFSMVGSPIDQRTLDVIVGTFSQGLTEALIRRFGAEIADHSDGLIDFITGFCATAPSFETTWDVAFGRAELALSRDADPLDTAVRVALRLTEMGYDSCWRATMPATNLRLHRMVLTGVEEIVVTSSAGSRQIAARCGEDTIEGRSSAGSAQWEWSENRRCVPTFGLSQTVYLLDAASAPPDELHGPAFVEDLEPLSTIETVVAEDFQQSLEVLATLGYSQWIERVMRGVLVTAKVPRVRIRSGSTNSLPGLFHISYPTTVMDIAETLVHECAHQYFHILKRLGDLDDGSDQTSYWSAAVNDDRPLIRILTAYHAFGNILLFYDALARAGIDDHGYIEQNEFKMRSKVADLQKPLAKNPALTDLGLSLYSPLAERLESVLSR